MSDVSIKWQGPTHYSGSHYPKVLWSPWLSWGQRFQVSINLDFPGCVRNPWPWCSETFLFEDVWEKTLMFSDGFLSYSLFMVLSSFVLHSYNSQPSSYVWQLYSVVHMWDTQRRKQGLSLILWQAFGDLFLIFGCLAMPPYEGRSLILPQLVSPCFVDTHGRPIPFWTETEEERMRGQKEVGRRKREECRDRNNIDIWYSDNNSSLFKSKEMNKWFFKIFWVKECL